METVTLLDAVETATTGAAELVNRASAKVYISIAGASAAVTVAIQERVGSEWYSIHEETFSAVGNMDPIEIDSHTEALRAVTSSHTSGTVTVTLAK